MTIENRPIKILFMLHTLTLGGTEKHLLRLLEALDPARFQPTLLVLTDQTSNEMKPQFETIRNLRIEMGPYSINSPRMFFWVNRFLNTNAFDVIMPFQPRCQFIASLYAHFHGHKGLVISERGDRSFSDPWLTLFDRSLMIPSACYFVANSYYGCEILRKRGANTDRIFVIPNGLDLNGLTATPPNHRPDFLPPNKKIIGYCGRLEPVKRVDDLIRAAAMLAPDTLALCHFVLVGEGSQRSLLERLAIELKVSAHFTFAGFQKNPQEIQRFFDLGVLVSAHEGFPNVILEMLANATPVIATAVTSIPEIIVHEKTGFLVNAKDPVGLAKGIAFLLHHPEEAKTMGAAGNHLLKTKYSMSRVISEYENLFETIAGVAKREERASAHH